MKLSKREAVMLTVLLVIALFFIEFKLILTPGIANLQRKYTELDSLEYELMTINTNLTLAQANAKKRDANLVSIAKLAEPFLNGVTPDSLLVFSHEMLIKHSFTPFSYTPATKLTAFLQPEQAKVAVINYRLKEIAEEYANLGKGTMKAGDQSASTNTTSKTTGVNDMMEVYSLQIDATGSYEQIKSMLNDYDSLGKTVIISNLALSPAAASTGLLNVKMTINYFGIKKIEASTDALNQWTRGAQSSSTNNPFTQITPAPTTVKR